MATSSGCASLAPTSKNLAYGVAVNSTSAYFVGFNDGEALPGTTAQGGFDAWVKVYDSQRQRAFNQAVRD